VLLDDSNIVDCAVIGLKLKPDYESPRAYVVRKPGSKITEDEVKDIISTKLASYKALTGGVVFVDEIPKSPSGKILKRILREQAEEELKKSRAKL
jgi:4-coumarate--CoA ligase